MNRISRNERTPIFFNSIFMRKKLNMNGYKVQNTYNNNNKKKIDMDSLRRENLIFFQNLQRIKNK